MTRIPAYVIQSLIHSYNGRIALDIPLMEIPAGSVSAITGPNGSGKTTLLSILAFLQTPVSGSVLFNGIETARRRSRNLRRKVTLVHQKPVLFSTTVRNNIAYGLKVRGLSSKELDHRVNAMIKQVQLEDVSEKQAHSISGGEAQRVVLARALVLETPVLLLDEPTNSLDEASKPVFLRLLGDANQRYGATIILASHDSGFVSALTDRTFRIQTGKIVEYSDS
jgi:tungstate transport system ATP-binding protein